MSTQHPMLERSEGQKQEDRRLMRRAVKKISLAKPGPTSSTRFFIAEKR